MPDDYKNNQDSRESSSNKIEDILRKKYAASSDEPVLQEPQSQKQDKPEENIIKLRRIAEEDKEANSNTQTPITKESVTEVKEEILEIEPPVAEIPLEPVPPTEIKEAKPEKVEETKPAVAEEVPLEPTVVQDDTPNQSSGEDATGQAASNGIKKEPIVSPITKHKESHKLRYYRFILKSTLMGLSIVALIVAIGWVGPKVFGGFSIFGSSGEMSTEEVVEKVGKLVELPKGEEPTIATVTDLAPLQSQEFFKEAKVGDKVLIYSTSGKAILYRPSENKIIVIAPIKSQ